MKGARSLTDAEVLAILEALRSPRNRALFVLGLKTGFRISELVSLQVKDVYQHGRVVDRVWMARKNIKNKQEGQAVPLHEQARAELAVWVAELAGKFPDPETPLFLSRHGKALDRRTAWLVLTKAYAQCGLTGKLGTHCMRKTFARRTHEKLGRDLMKTQKALRHRRITSTVSYLSVGEEEIDDAILKS